MLMQISYENFNLFMFVNDLNNFRLLSVTKPNKTP